MEIVEEGDVYCAKRCGRRCKRSAYDRAVKEAEELCKLMGEGWEPRVWDNLGWCYSIGKGVAEIYPSRIGDNGTPGWKIVSYTCYINVRWAGGQRTMQFIQKAETAQAAFDESMREARTAMRELVQHLENLDD